MRNFLLAITSLILISGCAHKQSAKLFQPNEQQQKEINEWFAAFDHLSEKFDIEGMANFGKFPMYVISDDSKGNGVTRVWNRADYIKAMKQAMKDTPQDIEYDTVRIPMMISPNLAVVLTEWKIKGKNSESSQTLKYVDFLLKENQQWKFQTMIQGGWGDFL